MIEKRKHERDVRAAVVPGYERPALFGLGGWPLVIVLAAVMVATFVIAYALGWRPTEAGRG